MRRSIAIGLLAAVLIPAGVSAQNCEPDSVAVQILGSGGPRLDPFRTSTGYLLWVGDKARVLVDMGGGALSRFGQAQAKLAAWGFIAQDASLVHARGGDGQTPLHMAATIETADLLIAAGADLDARDVDHESTPAQYMVTERQPVARHLVTKGCRTDVLMTAALGDVGSTAQHLDADPACVRMRVDNKWFPKVNPKAGGTIYNWTLGFYASAHAVANRFGHAEVLQLLFDRTPPSSRVVEACWIEDDAAARRFRAETPGFPDGLPAEEQKLLAHAARNNQTAAVRLMLESGLPVAAGGQHNGTALHWAAYHGNPDMIREILKFKPDLEATDNDFKATPLGWAIHGSEHGWYARSGDYPAAVDALLQAGAKRPATIGGTPAVRAVLKRR